LKWFLHNNLTFENGLNKLINDQIIKSNYVTEDASTSNMDQNKGFVDYGEKNKHFVFIVPSYNNEKWIEFKKDMTFAFGQDGKEIGKGKWFLEDETNYLTIDYDGEDKTKNEHWRAQMNSPVLILIGNTNITKSGEQIKMDKVEERPGVNE